MRSMENILKQFHNFEECILLEVSWHNYGTTINLVFNYIWDTDRKIRPDLEQVHRVTVSFGLVQEFHFTGALNASVCKEPERINWGLNEIAMVRLEEQEDYLHSYKALPVRFHHLAVLWDTGRRIDIVFSTIEIKEG